LESSSAQEQCGFQLRQIDVDHVRFDTFLMTYANGSF
jgi:hypothetical protein